MQVFHSDRRLYFRARGQRQVGVDTCDPDFVCARPNCEQLLVAELLVDHEDTLQAQVTRAWCSTETNVLRADAETDRLPNMPPEIGKQPGRKLEAQALAGQSEPISLRRHVHADEIHGRRSYEAGNEAVDRFAV